MPIKAKELFIKENVVKTLMKRKAVKKNFYMYLIENVELCTRKECYQWEKLCSILKVLLSLSSFELEELLCADVIIFDKTIKQSEFYTSLFRSSSK